MRVDLKKFLFIGAEKDRLAFFQKAQDTGIVHFIDETPLKVKEPPQEIQDLVKAIKIVRGLPVKEQEEVEEYVLADGIVKKILGLKYETEKLMEEMRVLKLEIQRVEVFGDYSMQEIAEIERQANKKFQFFFAKKGFKEENPLPDEVIYIASDHGLDYFLAINDKAVSYENMIEMQITAPVGELKNRMEKAKEELRETEERLKVYEKYNKFLHRALIEKTNGYNLSAAFEFAKGEVEGTLFFIEGWVPINKIDRLSNLAAELNVHTEEVAIEETDSIPTFLENKGVSRVGEDLVHIYDTPSTTDKDPSLWVLICFSIFFAIIIGDAGYGTLFLAAALFIRYKVKKPTRLGKRVLNLILILCFSCITWGVLTNSFFGINFALDSPLRKVSLIQYLVDKKTAYHLEKKDVVWKEWTDKYPDTKQVEEHREFLDRTVIIRDGKISYDMLSKFTDNIMMELALLIGVIHISFSFLRNLKRSLSGLGWVVAIIGGYIYLPSYLEATSLFQFTFGLDREIAARDGSLMFIGGISFALIVALINNKLAGILELMNVVQIFADVMSYLRLYALGLASAIVSSTVNEMAVSLGFFMGGFLILAGHSVNMVLGIMGGVIHGLRLNFLEWYHYCFEGGGKLFKPLEKIEAE